MIGAIAHPFAMVAGVTDHHLRTLSDLLVRTVEHLETAFTRRDLGLHTGITELDWALGPLEAGSVTVVASGRGGGRSTLASQIALGARPSVMLTSAMTASELAARLLVTEARLDGGKVRQGELSETMWFALGAAIGRLEGAANVHVVGPVSDLDDVRGTLASADGTSKTVVLDGIDIGQHLGHDSRWAAIDAVSELAGASQAAWVVTVGLSRDDYDRPHGHVFDAFLDSVPQCVSTVVWLDGESAALTRTLKMHGRNRPTASIAVTRQPGVPRFSAVFPGPSANVEAVPGDESLS